MEPNQMRAWRWVALAAVIANVAFNYLSESVLDFGADPPIVTDRYDSLFRPANYAFSIWGVIYAAFLAYTIHALTPGQRDVRLHDRLSVPLAVTNLLASLFVVVFRLDAIGASLAVILATAASAWVLYDRSRPATTAMTRVPHALLSPLVGVPFSLLLGWISVATLANLIMVGNSLGIVASGASSDVASSAVLLAIAAVVGVAVAIRFHDGVVPAVVSWASVAIWVTDRTRNSTIAGIALSVGVVTGLVAAYFLARSAHDAYLRHHDHGRHDDGRFPMPKV